MKISYLSLLRYQACTHNCRHLSVLIVYTPKIQFTFTYRNARRINLKNINHVSITLMYSDVR